MYWSFRAWHKMHGATGPTGPGVETIAFGGMYSIAENTLPLPNPGVAEVVAMESTYPLQNMARFNNSLIIEKTGNYSVSYSLRFTPTTSGVVSILLSRNGVLQPTTQAAIPVNAGVAAELSLQEILPLVQGDVIMLWALAETSNLLVTASGVGVSLTLTLLS